MGTTDPITPVALAAALVEAAGAKTSLRVVLSEARLFDDLRVDAVERSRARPPAAGGTYAFLAADLPLGGPRVRAAGRKMRRNWGDICLLAPRVAPGGLAAAVIEPAFWARDWAPFAAALAALGLHLIAVVRFAGLAHAEAAAPVTLGVFARQRRESLFVADAAPGSSARALAEAIVGGSFGVTLNAGLAVPPADFRGIDQLLVENELRVLEVQCPGCRRCRLVPDLALPENVRVCRAGGPSAAGPKAIYIPRAGKAPVVARLEDGAPVRGEYLRVAPVAPEVSPEYLALYFRSFLGRLTLHALRRGLCSSRLPPAALENVIVPVPDRADQENIVRAHARLLDLERALAVFRAELSINPRSASALVEHADAMLRQVNLLSAAEQVLALIRAGESRSLEFKETLTLDLRKGAQAAYMEKMVLKTIAAFLNSQGGTLLVGVADDGRVTGLQKEMGTFFKGGRDDLLRHFKNILRRSVGETFYPLIDYNLVEVNGAPVLRIDCRPADHECFLDATEFYVRTNPATDQLHGQKMIEYIRQRFKA